MERRRAVAVAVIGGAAVLVALIAWWRDGDRTGTRAPELAGSERRAGVDQEVTAAAAPIAPGGGASPRSRSDADVLRRAIEEARRTRVAELTRAAGGAASAASPRASEEHAEAAEAEAEAVGTLDPEYVRDAVRELIPLLGECYELALESSQRAGDDPPEGRLVTRFVIGGEPEVGGVIEESEVLEESELHHPLLEECFTETLATIELPSPEGGGRVTVHYPFELHPDDEAGEEP